ncbi:SRPBCC family protein [Microbispora sp. NPDC049125]|uniref:SRPBCC family protein n=1 Tax=Microbispora sp. NPDC049125 TaxID=3154929 RepID=UPI003466887E
MKQLVRFLAALFAAALLLPALSAPARADTIETDAQIAAEWQAAWDFYKFYQVATAPLPYTGRSRVERDISIDIDAPREHVFEVYSNFDNHVGRHSFLQRIVTHKDWTDGGVHYVNFTAIENIPIAGVPVTTKTHGQQRVHPDGFYYETDSWTLPNVVTHQKIVFTDLGDGRTRVTEHLMFEASVLLIDFTVTNGVASHQETQAGLKEAIESGEL